MDGTALCSLANQLAGFLHAPGETIEVTSGTGDVSAVAGCKNAGMQYKVRKLLIDCLQLLDLTDSTTYSLVKTALQHIAQLMTLEKLNGNQRGDQDPCSLTRKRQSAVDQWQTLAALVGTNEDDALPLVLPDAVPGVKREVRMRGKDRASSKSGCYQPNAKVRKLSSVSGSLFQTAFLFLGVALEMQCKCHTQVAYTRQYDNVRVFESCLGLPSLWTQACHTHMQIRCSFAKATTSG
eukprot:Skav212751  [mRNA]  locus=scaffold2545:96056:96766:- [translate_table: standard]